MQNAKKNLFLAGTVLMSTFSYKQCYVYVVKLGHHAASLFLFFTYIVGESFILGDNSITNKLC